MTDLGLLNIASSQETQNILIAFLAGVICTIAVMLIGEARHQSLSRRRVRRYARLLDDLGAALRRHSEHRQMLLTDLKKPQDGVLKPSKTGRIEKPHPGGKR